MWDATFPDTFTPSYTISATSEAGLVAAGAEERKEAKYTSLGSLHCFTPLAIETTGVLGPKSMTFVKSSTAWKCGLSDGHNGLADPLPRNIGTLNYYIIIIIILLL